MADLDDIETVAALYLLWKAEQRRRRRTRPWVNPRIQRRSQLGEYQRLVQELRLDAGRFQQYFCLSPAQFDDLLSRIGERITLQDTNYRLSIPAVERLSICLRYLAMGDSYHSIANSFRVGLSTVSSIVPQVVTAIWECLRDEFMAVPSTEDWRSISEEFEQRWNFPLCCGAVDGKRVQIRAPSRAGSQFSDDQGGHSVVLIAVVDAQYRFRIIDVGYGRSSDGGFLANSTFGQALQAGSLHLPPDQHLPGAEHRGAQPHVFVADEAFPLQKHMMRPFPEGGELSLEERVFNSRLSRARLVVKDALGILTSQWRWYRRLIDVRLEVVEQCVKATCVLQNFIRASAGDEAAAERNPPGDDEPLRGLSADDNSSAEAVFVRDIFKGHFMAEGAVPWQPKA